MTKFFIDYSSKNKFKLEDLTKHKLSTLISQEYLEDQKPSKKPEKYLYLAAKWAEDEWGYIRKFVGIEERIQIMIKLGLENFYIITYGNQPVGMFALLDKELSPEINKYSLKAKELMYFYVLKDFRNSGIGALMIKMAKNIAQEENASLIQLDTLKQKLNKFYEKSGAKIIDDNQLLNHPTTVLCISHFENENNNNCNNESTQSNTLVKPR